jgi:hypothetical protein
MTRLIALLLSAAGLTLATLTSAADKPELVPPQVKFTGAKTTEGHTLWTFEVANPNDVPVPYVGYTSDSFEGGLPEGSISPLFRIQLQQAGEWKAHPVGFCGTGIGPVTLPAKSKVTFAVIAPPGDYSAAQVGLAWSHPGAPEDQNPSIAWCSPIKPQEPAAQ